jgi:hypothetical protein
LAGFSSVNPNDRRAASPPSRPTQTDVHELDRLTVPLGGVNVEPMLAAKATANATAGTQTGSESPFVTKTERSRSARMLVLTL